MSILDPQIRENLGFIFQGTHVNTLIGHNQFQIMYGKLSRKSVQERLKIGQKER